MLRGANVGLDFFDLAASPENEIKTEEMFDWETDEKRRL
jgi:hypothetical protein